MNDHTKAKFQHKYYSLKNSNDSNIPPVEDYHKTLYELFNISRSQEFEHINIENVDYSLKMINKLRRAGLTTMNDLFSKSILDLLHLSQIGEKSIRSVISFCEYFLDINQYERDGFRKSDNQETPPPAFLYNYAQSLLQNSEFSTENYSETDQKQISKVKEAFFCLGEDLFQSALEKNENNTQTTTYLAVIDDFSEYFTIIDAVDKKISILLHNHSYLQNVPVKPLFDLYKCNIESKLPGIFAEEDLFCEIPSIMKRISNFEERDITSITNNILSFIEWVGSGIADDLKEIRKKIVSRDKSERREIIIELQQEGNTLMQIGSLLDITRERVRQISEDAINCFISDIRKMDKDPVLFIHIMTGNQKLLFKKDVNMYLRNSKITDWLWACLQSGRIDCSSYEYIKKNDAVYFPDVPGILYDEIDNIISEFPDFIAAEQAALMIKEKSLATGISEETLQEAFQKNYRSYGKYYSTKRLSKRFVVDWILKRSFPSGYKINDNAYQTRFLSFISYNFGEEIASIDTEELDRKISNVGVLCNRGKYVHPSRVIFNKRILDEIDHFIQRNRKTAISYKEIFQTFEKKLRKNNINNQYFLQGIMNFFGKHGTDRTPYYSFRDYVTKDKDFSKNDEVDYFIRKRGIVHKSDIIREFSDIDYDYIPQLLQRCPDVISIGNGKYIHASLFHITEEDFRLLRKYLNNSTAELPVNIRIVYTEVCTFFPDFIKRNKLDNHDTLYAILYYMFRDEFDFSKPYISKKGEGRSTTRNIILSILEPYDKIDIDILLGILENRGIAYNSITSLMNFVYPEYIRTDINTFVKFSCTGLTEEIIRTTLNEINKTVERRGYLSARIAPKNISLPIINVKWTTYLIECLVVNNTIVNYIFFPSQVSGRNTNTVVYIGKKYKGFDFQTLILDVLSSEYDKGSFKRKSDIQKWLIGQGLIDNSLPTYLVSAKYFYYDSTGNLIKNY